MSLESAVEVLIKEAIERGDFANLRGQGKPIDLNHYFNTPAELTLASTALKNAGMVPEEVDLLKELGTVREQIEWATYEAENERIRRLIGEKQLKYDLLMERRRR